MIVTINPSIAVVVNISPIIKGETVPIFFDAEENWVGAYDVKLWNSDKKNEDFNDIATVATALKRMTLIINTSSNTKAGGYYYEIIKDNDRVIFKGKIEILD